MAGSPPRQAVRIQSLARANGILEAVAAAPKGSASLTEISQALGLNKTTVFNLAASLVALGFLERGRGPGRLPPRHAQSRAGKRGPPAPGHQRHRQAGPAEDLRGDRRDGQSRSAQHVGRHHHRQLRRPARAALDLLCRGALALSFLRLRQGDPGAFPAGDAKGHLRLLSPHRPHAADDHGCRRAGAPARARQAPGLCDRDRGE